MSLPGTRAPRASDLHNVLFVSSEIFPLAKTGGLADVASALPATLAALGSDVRLMLPGYPEALDSVISKRVVATLSDVPGSGRLIEGLMPDTGLPVYLYDAPALYRRDGTLYQDRSGQDWPDNHLRYAALCHAAAHVARDRVGLDWQPDVVHANDWHTGLLPALLAAGPAPGPATVFTIHNLAFQGNFNFGVLPDLWLPLDIAHHEGIEFFGQISFLKAGIRYADRLTTVSPTYAREILTPEYGCGLDGLLRMRAEDLVGILNGVDYRIWDPACDEALACKYHADDVSGKVLCKAAVQDELGLERSDRPMVIFVNRFTHQKMADVLLAALPALVDSGVQVVLHGQGERRLEDGFRSVAANSGGAHLAVRVGYDETLARRLTAAADMSITASRFEPCGLTTMYAMRYGALPVTRRVGGIADTVVDADSDLAGDEGASGFVFKDDTPDQMIQGVRRATNWFRSHHWTGIQKSAMRRDFGWERSARRYLELYRSLPGVGRGCARDDQPGEQRQCA
jgi:starch synthase